MHLTQPQIDPLAFAWTYQDEYLWAVTYSGVHISVFFMLAAPGSPRFDEDGVRQDLVDHLERMLEGMSHHERIEFWLKVTQACTG